MIHKAVRSHKKRTLPLISNCVSRNLKNVRKQLPCTAYSIHFSLKLTVNRGLYVSSCSSWQTSIPYKNVPKKTIMSQKLFLTQLKRVSNKSKCNDEMIWKVESRKSKSCYFVCACLASVVVMISRMIKRFKRVVVLEFSVWVKSTLDTPRFKLYRIYWLAEELKSC